VAEAGIPARRAVTRGSNLEVGDNSHNLRRWAGAATVSPPAAEATVNRRRLLLRNKVGGNHRAEHRQAERLLAERLLATGVSPREQRTEVAEVDPHRAGRAAFWPRLRSAA
jgi:hypothetical protein